MVASEYWKNPGEGNEPRDYWSKIGRSEFLLSFIEGIIPKDKLILELGCNSGRNLKFLSENGYNVFGIDINEQAVLFARQKEQSAYSDSIEQFFKTDVLIPVILTMAVLEHIPVESEYIFMDMAKSDYIITIEDEQSKNEICFSRNYKTIFENLGMKEIKHETVTGELFCTTFEARIFQRI
jgi:SAM-dependent methyltransferase